MLPPHVNHTLSESQNIIIENYSFKHCKLPYYICQISQAGYRPVIGLVNLIDYQNLHSKIIPHEQVNENKVADYVQKFIDGGILNNPILLFYKKFQEFQYYLEQLIHDLAPINKKCINGTTYKIWQINCSRIITKLQGYLDKISKLYVADGHHRIHALSKVREQSTGAFSQMYISFIVQEDNLRLGSFNRFIRGVDINIESFMKQLKKKYIVDQVHWEALDLSSKTYIYIEEMWYQLHFKKQAKVSQFPPIHIDKFITSVFLSHSPSTGKILYSPGTDCIDDILQFYRQNQCQLAIHVPKLSFHDLLNTFEKRNTLPPHSTCFTPKIPNDLFVQMLDFSNDYTRNIAI